MAIVGAKFNDDKGDASGSAYVFSRNQGGTDNWGEVNKLIASDGTSDDQFGYSVAISGGTAVAGAFFGDGEANSSGVAYLYSTTQTYPITITAETMEASPQTAAASVSGTMPRVRP